MAKKIKTELVNEFIKQKLSLEKQLIEVAILQEKLRKLEKKGYYHPLLAFEDNISYRPPWKTITQELTEKYMTKGARALFFNRTLPKRFPKTHGKKKILIKAPKYEAACDKLLAKKKALGLTSVED